MIAKDYGVRSPMSVSEEVEDHTEEVVEKFTKYLNGPQGKVVRESMEDNESYILKTKDCTMRVTKKGLKIEVEVID